MDAGPSRSATRQLLARLEYGISEEAECIWHLCRRWRRYVAERTHGSVPFVLYMGSLLARSVDQRISASAAAAAMVQQRPKLPLEFLFISSMPRYKICHFF